MDKDKKIDVGSLTQQLVTSAITTSRFRWPVSYAQAIDILTAAYQAEVIKRHGTPLMDEPTMLHIRKVAELMTSDGRKFGLMLCGTYGNGKTTMLYAIRSATNLLNRMGEFAEATGIYITDARDIARAYTSANPKEWKYLKEHPRVAIEDMGKEPTEQMSYGTVISPVSELLEWRYNEQLFTAITTNLTPQEVREKYGSRIADRFAEMMLVIPFHDHTYHKN